MDKQNKARRATGAAALLAAGIVAAPFATALETVTVVATRSAAALDELPEYVSVVDAAAIADAQASSIAEVLRDLAGVDTAGGLRPGAQSVVVRGIGGNRVLYTLDGARQSFEGGHRGRFTLEPELIKRVDVLRGPASAQYGSGAIGGVLAVTSRDAADLLRDERRLGAVLKSGYESAGNQRQSTLIGYGRLGDIDIVAQRGWRENSDFEDGSGDPIEHTGNQLDSQLLKTSWLPDHGHSLSFSHLVTRQQNETPSNPAETVSDSNPLLSRNNRSRSKRLSYRFEGSGFSAFELTLYENLTDIVEDRLGQSEPRHDELSFDTVGGNLSVRYAFEAPHTLSAGLDINRDRSNATRNGAPRPQYPDAEQTVEGAYLQYEADPADYLSLVAGLRADRFHSQSNIDAAADVEARETTARLGLSLFATDWLTLHGNYTEAFRAPNLLENYATGTHFLGNEFQPNPALRPELAANREIAVVIGNGDSSEHRYHLRLNAYRNDIRDFIETVVVVETDNNNLACLGLNPPPGCVFGTVHVGGTTTAVNLTRARISGWELESRYRYREFLAELAYGRSRGVNTTDDSPLLNIPADAIKLHLAWERESVRIGARLRHYRDQQRVPPTDVNGIDVHPTPGYTLVDLYTRWYPQRFIEGLSLQAGIDNLTDRRYRSHLSSLNAPGRNVRLSLSYQL